MNMGLLILDSINLIRFSLGSVVDLIMLGSWFVLNFRLMILVEIYGSIKVYNWFLWKHKLKFLVLCTTFLEEFKQILEYKFFEIICSSLFLLVFNLRTKLLNKINITTYFENLTIKLRVLHALSTCVKFCVNRILFTIWCINLYFMHNIKLQKFAI